MGSKYICEKLIEMGLVHDKTYNLNFEKLISYVPDELIHHFIRGMFDGDGSIKYYNYEYAKGYQYHFGYTGLKNVCEFVSIFLHMNTKLIMECENFYTCRTANANVILYIYEKLYNNATVYCDRKHNTFLEVILLINRENKNTVNGVNWNKQSNKWLAIYGCKDKNNKKINKRLGNFDNKEDAIKARLQYEYELHGNNARQWFFFEKYKIGEYSNE